MPVINVLFADQKLTEKRDAILRCVEETALETLNTQGGLTREHLIITAADIWEGLAVPHAFTVQISTKRTPDYQRGQHDFTERIAVNVKKRLVALGVLNESQVVKVALTLNDIETAAA